MSLNQTEHLENQILEEDQKEWEFLEEMIIE
jgi:hypothetical protein